MADSPSSNNDATLFLALIIAAAVGWLLWHLLHEQIIYVLRWIRFGEMWVLNHLVDSTEMRQFQAYFGASGSKISWQHIAFSSLLVGHYLAWPVAAVLALCAAWVMFKAPKIAFKHTYGLDKLIAVQSRVWPVISPFIGFDPAASNSRDPTGPLPDRLPVFAEALSPDEWLKFYRIARSPEGIDREAAAAVLAAQLGPRWQGARALPMAARALFAVCALKMARKREPADALLGRLAAAVETKGNAMQLKPDLALRREIDQIVRDPALGGLAEQVAARHAFATPAMLHVLSHARDRAGVLAPAQFVWLRGVNRALWYPLNNLGRRAFHPEAAGAMAHYEAELAANRPLLTPKVKNAVDALEKYSHDNPYTPTLQLTG